MNKLKYSKIILLILLTGVLYGQSNGSLAFKKNRPQDKRYTPGLTVDMQYRMAEKFFLIREANVGNPEAQHELGIRYLLGEEFEKDTTLSYYWISRAADAGHTSASYNKGIFLMNGWGTKWNPFDAYSEFRKAAYAGMPQAQFIVGIMFTENLIIPRNLDSAYAWVKKADKAGYEPAKDVMKRLIAAGAKDDDALPGNGKENIGETGSEISARSVLLYINFDPDTTKPVTDSLIAKELLDTYSRLPGSDSLFANLTSPDSIKLDSSLIIAADYGSPEAMAALGRIYEKGLGTNPDRVMAAIWYLRAYKYESTLGGRLFNEILGSPGLINEIESRVYKNDKNAAYLWALLTFAGANYKIGVEDAKKILTDLAASGYVFALLDLAQYYYTGSYFARDKEKATGLLNMAYALGNNEAPVRKASYELRDDFNPKDAALLVNVLDKGIEKGSLIAQTMKGYCYQFGIGVEQSFTGASRLYMEAANRGSKAAFSFLRKMYDSLRPTSPEFVISEE